MFSISFDALTKGEKIGEGGFGIVYKGTYRFGPAAIKQLHIDNLSPEAEEEFNKEATIMAQLHHPNIVHFYGYCTVPKCLVMEYMPKGSLFTVLHDKKQSLDWNIKIRIATGMVSGLAFLHSRNILHRDIKSLNVLLDDQSAKLTDFGLSKVKNETKSQTTANKTSKDSVGTVQWMAPELFRRKAVYTQKSDIYSLGITFWELAAHKIPYAEDTQAAIPAFVERGDREDIPSNCPEKLAYLIQQCWAGNPEARPNAADIARFMITDAKTLKDVEASLESHAPESIDYQLTSQVSPSSMPYQGNLHFEPELAGFENLQVTPPSSSNSPLPSPKRRSSNILNLTDKKEGHEKVRYVLEELRTFFREGRDIGSKTENYAIYNEYLKKANGDAELTYNAAQDKHILYVNDKSLDTETAAIELSKMLRSLAASVPAKPMASPTVRGQSPVAISTRPIAASPKALAQTVPKTTPQATLVLAQQNPPPGPAMLAQFKKVSKLASKVNTSDSKELCEFLKFVAQGEQDQAEAMLKRNPDLALLTSDVTDFSGRFFKNITGFQYAVWALDWHMWTMIRKHLPDEAAKEQAKGFEKGSWVGQYGIHARHLLDNLVQALQVTIDLYNTKQWKEGDTAWVQQVGGAQLLLPAHVINEYCHPTRPFYPCPHFRDAFKLPRTRQVDKQGWTTLCRTQAICRAGGNATANRRVPGMSYSAGFQYWQDHTLVADRDCVIYLSKIRTAQREELINELKPRNTQITPIKVSLIEAIKQNNQAEVFRLLNLKTNSLGERFIDEVDLENGTALYWAAVLGHVHFVTPLVEAGADINKPDRWGATPVFAAAKNGHALAITALRAAGADVNTRTSNDVTPVYIAAHYGYTPVIAALHAAGADMNTHSSGRTPVYIAAYHGHVSAIAALHAAGADVNTLSEGDTPVCIAARYDHASAIAALYAAGADVNAPDSRNGWTPVHIAAYCGHASAIAALRAAGANVNTASSGSSPLCAAASKGHVLAVNALLEAGADGSIKTKLDGTALEQAKRGREASHREVVRLLEAHLKSYPNGIKGSGTGNLKKRWW